MKVRNKNESREWTTNTAHPFCLHFTANQITTGTADHSTQREATAMGGALMSQPWRPMSKDNEENLNFIKSYVPKKSEVKRLRILLHGPVGAGKSSFINSVDSVFQGKITGRALTDSTSGSSFTRRYKTFKFSKDDGFYSIVCNDMMGFEADVNAGVHLDDVKLAIRGHVEEGYQFNPGQPLTEDDCGYNSSPTLEDKVHVLVSVIPANSVAIISDEVVYKMREIRLAASEMGIPQLTILTKVDEACPEAKSNINNVYKSVHLKSIVDKFSLLLGLPLNCIFLVKNYDSEIYTNEGIDKLILMALRQMISFGEDTLNNP